MNWNISVTSGKENECDSLSSGERNGKSLNLFHVNLYVLWNKGCGMEACREYSLYAVIFLLSWIALERAAVESDSLVNEK